MKTLKLLYGQYVQPACLCLGIMILFASCGLSSKNTGNAELSYKVLKYGPDSCHARGIEYYNKSIYTANSNGYVYRYDLKKKKSGQLNSIQLVELRDISVRDDSSFIAMQSHDSSFLYLKKENSHSTWSGNPPTFFDGMDLTENGFGILMGDPLNGELQVYLTKDYGNSWQIAKDKVFHCNAGEAGFAASGTNVQAINDSCYVFVSGGKASRFFKTRDAGLHWSVSLIPYDKSESSGPFSVCFWDEMHGVTVGGNYSQASDTTNNCFLTSNGGKSWQRPVKTTSGYKSCVLYHQGIIYACGTNGIDVSDDLGMHWKQVSRENCFALTAFEDEVYATTTKGRILVFKALK